MRKIIIFLVLFIAFNAVVLANSFSDTIYTINNETVNMMVRELEVLGISEQKKIADFSGLNLSREEVIKIVREGRLRSDYYKVFSGILPLNTCLKNKGYYLIGEKIELIRERIEAPSGLYWLFYTALYFLPILFAMFIVFKLGFYSDNYFYKGKDPVFEGRSKTRQLVALIIYGLIIVLLSILAAIFDLIEAAFVLLVFVGLIYSATMMQFSQREKSKIGRVTNGIIICLHFGATMIANSAIYILTKGSIIIDAPLTPVWLYLLFYPITCLVAYFILSGISRLGKKLLIRKNKLQTN